MLLAVISLASVGKVVTFLVMLSILVVLHEYGHFIVARRNRVKVNEFAVGMGPKIVGWKSRRSGTLYSLRLLPIGGYCAMEGEDNKTSEAEQQREFREARTREFRDKLVAIEQTDHGNFQAKTPWQRLAIVLAGPVANFILCYAILLIGTLIVGVPSDKIDKAVVEQLVADFPAAQSGMHVGDRVVSVRVGGQEVVAASKLVDSIHGALGKPIDVTFVHDGAVRTIHVTPVPCPQDSKQGCIGFLPTTIYERVSLGDTFRYANLTFVDTAERTFESLGMLVTHFTQYAPQVSGVIGMGQAATTIQDFGWGPYLSLAALISFALGLFNLLPIPALDGGRAAFIIAELLRGRPVDPEREAMVHFVGFSALIALMAVIAYHDITRIVSGKGVF